MLTDSECLLNEQEICISYQVKLTSDGDMKSGNIISESINKFDPSDEQTGGSSTPKSFKSECDLSDDPDQIETPLTRHNNCCSICQKEYPDTDTYVRHLNEAHSKEECSRVWCCLRCQDAFPSAEALLYHTQIVHSIQILPLPPNLPTAHILCKICSKQFYSNWSYKKHLKMHYPPYQFTCKTCNKSFSKSFNLRRHEIIHTDQRPYICGKCGMSYRDPSALKKHQTKNHC